MTKSKTSLTTANKPATFSENLRKLELNASVTRSFSLPFEADLKLANFMASSKRSRSSVIAEALTDFLSKQKAK